MALVLLSAGELGRLNGLFSGTFRRGLAIELAFQRRDPAFTQTMTASPQSLKMFLRGDCDGLDRVFVTTDLDRTLETPPDHFAVIELIAKPGLGPGEKFFGCDPSSHARNVWDNLRIWDQPLSLVMLCCDG